MKLTSDSMRSILFHRSLWILLTALVLNLSVSAIEYQRSDTTTLKNGCLTFHISETSIPWDIYVLEIDLTNRSNKLKTCIANEKVAWVDGAGNSFVNKETLGSMVKRFEQRGQDVIGGINSDFFNMANGMQFNVTAIHGEIVSTGITPKNHAAFYVDDDGNPYIGMVDRQQKVSIKGKGDYVLNGINKIRGADELVLYSSYIGQNNSFANEWGMELLVEPLDSGMINGVRSFKVLGKAANVHIKKAGQQILSGHGQAKIFLNQAETGDLIRIYTQFPGLVNQPIEEMIGGWGHIVQKGQNCAVSSIEEEGTMEHENDRHPRSAVGYNKAKTKLYIVAVDGRSDLSKGMNLTELADFMIQELGVYEGLNFDGGGSTTLMAGNETINNPSGGVHRAVANALFVFNENIDTTKTSYSFETQSTTTIHEGANLFFEEDSKNKASVWVLEVDRSKQNIDVAPVIANNRIGWSDAYGIDHKSHQKLSEMVNLAYQEGDSSIIGAVNASPFNIESFAIAGLNVVDGVAACISDSSSYTPSLWIDETGEPFISNLRPVIKVRAANSEIMPVNSVNGVRWLDNLVLYNSFIGSKTNTNQWGGELRLEPKRKPTFNGISTYTVTEKVATQASGTGKMLIGDGEFVLSGNGKAFEFIRDNINVGQTLELISEVEGANGKTVKHSISGSGIVIKDGEAVSQSSEIITTSEPIQGKDIRTAVGYNSDKSKFYLFAGEDFTEKNIGLSIEGMVELMKKYNISDGLCLDGGNNSTMFTDDQLVNVDEQNEATIPNGIIIKSSKLTGIEIPELQYGFSVFPNPAGNQISLKFEKHPEKEVIFQIYNISGKLLFTRDIQPEEAGAQTKLDVSGLSNGVYIYRLKGNDNEFGNGTLIINK